MAHNTIAVIADCDGTLAPDTTDQILQAFGIDPAWFWPTLVEPLVKQGWDEQLAYLQKFIELAKPGQPLEGLSSQRLTEIAKSLQFYQGIPDGLIQLKDEIEHDSNFRSAGVRVEFYVISAGIGDLLRASALASAVHRIWACDFAYDADGIISHIKNVISFTDKTRFVYMVNKGKVAEDFSNKQYVVNEPMDEAERPVPFKKHDLPRRWANRYTLYVVDWTLWRLRYWRLRQR